MNGGSRIIDIRPERSDAVADQVEMPEQSDEPVWTTDGQQPAAEPVRHGWLIALAVLLSLGWLGTMLWLSAPVLAAGMAPVALVQFIAALCVPIVLITTLCLLLMRTSRAEARRFAATSAGMRAEAAALERAIAAISATLETNRQELSRQTGELIAMGERAGDGMARASELAADKSRTIIDSADRLDQSMDRVDQRLNLVMSLMPKAKAEAEEMTAALDTAGLRAGEHVASLSAELARVAERGREANEIAGGAAERLAAHIGRMEATSEVAGARLEAVTSEMSDAVDGVLDRAATAIEEARRGISAQGEAMLAMLSTNQAAIERTGLEGSAALADRISAIEQSIERVAERLGEQRGATDALFERLDRGVDHADQRMAAMHSFGLERSQSLAAAISALDQSAQAMTRTLESGDDMARSVIVTSESLLLALEAAAREVDETLPEALARLDHRIAASRRVVMDAKPELLALVTAAESTHDAIEAIAGVIATQRDTLAALSQHLLETLDTGHDRINGVRAIADATIETTRRFAEDSAPHLIETLVRIRETAQTASDHARKTLGDVIPSAVRQLETEGTAALENAVDRTVRRQIDELAEAGDAASMAVARASERLSQQIFAIAEATATVETRLQSAREERDKHDHDQFARRVSLLIEALNSTSIDIAKIFAQDVTDSAWSAYLKGDRGVFTRRAVRLLEPGQAREIAQLYDNDDTVREQINRYIHDFESMLRQVLGLRDGSPLGVTLLSSDMGKLYVALAQAIERLRI
ncbi:hypothetical protein NYR55_02540 [Sphingomonas sp. BGYR3]|uniref:hypothetical protein n=1 Tax=Sphingomonas sp. BGYR3 TaxID=2975483 RepID=UPI0021A8C396|nr:hypothetical protein [Sphingomonas sp. BGYR3]MDG5487504.1 hypothetical protein [Sphingomonas sp. BGYR3]